MRKEIAERLLKINQEFYQTFAGPFGESRQRPQPGVLKACAWINSAGTVLDLGCGHGLLPAALHEGGFQGSYLGLDSSEHLLELARKRQLGPSYRFQLADLAHPGWVQDLSNELQSPGNSSLSFDQICCFATLHHLPGAARRTALMREILRLLDPAGKLTLSTWNFLESPRLRRRVLPWERAGLRAAEVEAGDYLLDWRRGGLGLRYVHHFTEQELLDLAGKTGCEVVDTFYSDGEHGDLGLYQVWRRE